MTYKLFYCGIYWLFLWVYWKEGFFWEEVFRIQADAILDITCQHEKLALNQDKSEGISFFIEQLANKMTSK